MTAMTATVKSTTFFFNENFIRREKSFDAMSALEAWALILNFTLLVIIYPVSEAAHLE